MRRIAVVTCSIAALIALACAKSETKSSDSSAAAAVPPPPPSITAADLAGTWTITAKNEAGDSTLVTLDLMATADTTGWMMHVPNRPPLAVRVLMIAGDSVVSEAGPYESVLRKGVQVTTHSVYHLQNGMLRGMTTAHYSNVKTADSVRNLPVEGTKKP